MIFFNKLNTLSNLFQNHLAEGRILHEFYIYFGLPL